MAKAKRQINDGTIFFYILLALTIGFAAYILKNFLSTIALATILSILLVPSYNFLKEKCKIPSGFAIMIGLVGALVLVFVPLIFLIIHLGNEIIALTQTISIQEVTKQTWDLSYEQRVILFVDSYQVDLTERLVAINSLLDSLTFGNVQITLEQLEASLLSSLVPLRQWAVSVIVAIGSSSLSIIARVFLFIIIVASILPNRERIRNYIKTISPLDDSIDEVYLTRITAMTLAMVKGTFVVAFVQSMLSATLLWFAGVEYLVTLTALMFFLSILPVVGTPLVTVPIGILFMLNGQILTGLSIILIQIIFISNVDNVLRPRLVSKEAMLSPALLLLGVFGGLELYGFLGVVYGPVIMIMLDTTLNVYVKYYQNKGTKKVTVNST